MTSNSQIKFMDKKHNFHQIDNDKDSKDFN